MEVLSEAVCLSVRLSVFLPRPSDHSTNPFTHPCPFLSHSLSTLRLLLHSYLSSLYSFSFILLCTFHFPPSSLLPCLISLPLLFPSLPFHHSIFTPLSFPCSVSPFQFPTLLSLTFLRSHPFSTHPPTPPLHPPSYLRRW